MFVIPSSAQMHDIGSVMFFTSVFMPSLATSCIRNSVLDCLCVHAHMLKVCEHCVLQTAMGILPNLQLGCIWEQRLTD